MTEDVVWAIVPAAGIGARIGGRIPKQYLPLGSRTVIDHSVERLLMHPAVNGIYLALNDEDTHWARTEYAGHLDLVLVPGGRERCYSVSNALDSLSKRAKPSDWVMVHDAARPCVRRTDIDHLIELVADHPVGGLLGAPVHDTMKRTDPTDRIIDTVDREHLWRAFTPQIFRVDLLKSAIDGALTAGVQVTDEASAVEWAGHHPLMVEGHQDNIKITRPEDLELAAYYLDRQAQQEAV